MYKIGRNEKCWCGSGRKYKACHEASDEENLKDFVRQGYPIPTSRLILSPEQINGVKESARISTSIMDELDKFIKEGISTLEIDDLVVKLTDEAGAISADLGYNGFPKSCCTSINEVICHGIPSKKDVLKEGDIINVDITTKYKDYYSDMSRMYKIGKVSPEADKLVDVTKSCLEAGIEQVIPYTPVGNIGNTINDLADEHNYSVVRALTGHGVGLDFHLPPTVEHFRTQAKTMILVPNMVFTIEPMINIGTYDCRTLTDDWTVVTNDGSLSAQWEHTVLVTETGYEILT